MPTKTVTITADPEEVAKLDLSERLAWYFAILRSVTREFKLLHEEANDD